jgi:hypothetical protein
VSKTVKIVLSVWAVTALTVGFSAILPQYSVRVAQAIGTALTFTLILLYFLSKGFRGQALGWNLRTLTFFQAWRVIPGSLFLYYAYALGKLPFAFAVIGGWGDILVGLTAILISPLGTADRKHLVKTMLGWQFFGLLDLLFVIRSGFVASLSDPNIMRPLTEMPLVLLPLLLVPITLFVHFVSIAQLIKKLPQARP